MSDFTVANSALSKLVATSVVVVVLGLLVTGWAGLWGRDTPRLDFEWHWQPRVELGGPCPDETVARAAAWWGLPTAGPDEGDIYITIDRRRADLEHAGFTAVSVVQATRKALRAHVEAPTCNFEVLLHELGHAQGWDDHNRAGAVMAPTLDRMGRERPSNR